MSGWPQGSPDALQRLQLLVHGGQVGEQLQHSPFLVDDDGGASPSLAVDEVALVLLAAKPVRLDDGPVRVQQDGEGEPLALNPPADRLLVPVVDAEDDDVLVDVFLVVVTVPVAVAASVVLRPRAREEPEPHLLATELG